MELQWQQDQMENDATIKYVSTQLTFVVALWLPNVTPALCLVNEFTPTTGSMGQGEDER